MGFNFATRTIKNGFSIEVRRDNGDYNQIPLCRVSGSSVQETRKRLIDQLDTLIASEDDVRGIREALRRLYWI